MSKATIAYSLGAILGLLLLSGQGRAEGQATPPQPYVVLVGISKYADAKIKPRTHAEDDARALYDLFTNKDYLGVDKKHVKLLLGSPDGKRGSQPATRENILKALQWLASEARGKDPVIFAFFGNGGPLGDLGDRRCYFAADSTFKDRDKDAIAAADVGEALKNLKSREFATFLDVDFKGFDSESVEPNLGANPYREFLGDDGTEEKGPISGRVVFLATNGLSTSLDLKEHGLFAKVLLEGLKGAADKDGYEPDGQITVDELSSYLDKRIPRLANEFGKTREEKNQQHWVLGGRANHFVLTHNPAVMPAVKERLEKLETLLKDSKMPAKFGVEGRQLLERMPRLTYQRNLRKDYQALVDGTIDQETFETRRDAILEGTRLRDADAAQYAKKVIEASELVKENYVKEINQGDLVAAGIKGLYRRIEEKAPPEIEAKLKTVKKMNEEELTKLLSDVRLQLGKREDLDKHKDLDITLQRMLAHLDPYTTYIDPESLTRFNQDITGNFRGIGIQIRKDNASDMLLVVTPIKGSPAYKAGLQAGDIVTRIRREVDSEGKALAEPEEISTKGLALSDAVKKILGKEGTKVKLTVQREGEPKPLEFELTRAQIEVETILGHKRDSDDNWDYVIDKENKIAYVRLTSFQRNSYRDLIKVMRDLSKQGVKGFVFDLRFNPGGLLDSAVKISDLFVSDGLIVSIRPRVGKPSAFHGHADNSLLDFPMVCLVNGASASGSEIVSAALQDHNRAWIVGERSYGKGSVQNIQPFEGGEIKLTTASFWRPSGKNLNKSSTAGKEEDEWGVVPDKEIKLSRKEREDLYEALHESEIIARKDGKGTKETKPEFKDKQLEEALKYLRKEIKVGNPPKPKKVG